MTLLSNGSFYDFDNKVVYSQSIERARNQAARNFVVEFGKEEAQVAFDLDSSKFKALLQEEGSAERPVRWM
jgi:hypothetical protein